MMKVLRETLVCLLAGMILVGAAWAGHALAGTHHREVTIKATPCMEDELLRPHEYDGNGPNRLATATYRCQNIEDFVRRWNRTH